MDHADHVRLLREAIVPGTWADLGSGEGAFTLALAELLVERGSIYSVDKDRGALEAQRNRMQRRFPAGRGEYRGAGFTTPPQLPPLDGLVLAHSLHFVRGKFPLLERLRGLMVPGGPFLLVASDA